MNVEARADQLLLRLNGPPESFLQKQSPVTRDPRPIKVSKKTTTDHVVRHVPHSSPKKSEYISKYVIIARKDAEKRAVEAARKLRLERLKSIDREIEPQLHDKRTRNTSTEHEGLDAGRVRRPEWDDDFVRSATPGAAVGTRTTVTGLHAARIRPASNSSSHGNEDDGVAVRRQNYNQREHHVTFQQPVPASTSARRAAVEAWQTSRSRSQPQPSPPRRELAPNAHKSDGSSVSAANGYDGITCRSIGVQATPHYVDSKWRGQEPGPSEGEIITFFQRSSSRQPPSSRSRGTQPFDLNIVEQILALENGKRVVSSPPKHRDHQGSKMKSRDHLGTSKHNYVRKDREENSRGGSEGQAQMMTEMARLMRSVTGLVTDLRGSPDNKRSSKKRGRSNDSRAGDSEKENGSMDYRTLFGGFDGSWKANLSPVSSRGSSDPKVAEPSAAEQPQERPWQWKKGDMLDEDSEAIAAIFQRLEKSQKEDERIRERLLKPKKQDPGINLRSPTLNSLPLEVAFQLAIDEKQQKPSPPAPPSVPALLAHGSTDAYEASRLVSYSNVGRNNDQQERIDRSSSRDSGEGDRRLSLESQEGVHIRPAERLLTDIRPSAREVDEAEEYRCEFIKYRKLQEAALHGTGMRQVDVVEMLADDLLERLVLTCCSEVEALFHDTAEKLVNAV